DHSWRKLSRVADGEEFVRASTPWREGPGVELGALLRSTGRSGTRGRAAAARDDTAAKAAIEQRRARRAARRHAAVDLILTTPPGQPLPDYPARVAYEALTAATRA